MIDDKSKKASMEKVIRRYFAGCNEASLDKMLSCFVPDAIHYFPPDMYDGPWVGAEKIARGWISAVNKIGSYWTIDNIIIDPSKDEAVIEWTHFKTKLGITLRGAEWYLFDKSSGLIKELWAYYASPQDKNLKTLELKGMNYVSRGFPKSPPPGER